MPSSVAVQVGSRPRGPTVGGEWLDGRRPGPSGHVAGPCRDRTPGCRTPTALAVRAEGVGLLSGVARRAEASRWRDLPTAVLMLAPSLVILGVFVVYPLGRAVWLGHSAATPRARTARPTAGTSTSTSPAATSSCDALLGDRQVRPAHRADRAGARRRPGRARRQVPARPRRLPLHLLVDDRHVGRRGQPDVAVPAAARHRRAVQRRLDRRPVPGRQVARACCATRARRWRRSPRRASGPASGSRSCSSRPGCRASPATSTRRPSSTAPAASAASGASRCRCSARRCCSSSSC